MIPWSPQSRAQAQALACPAQILLFGGAAGSLKSETMLMDAVRERDRSRLRAILFRRSYPELEKGLIRRSRELFSALGACYNEQKHLWRFPSGATVEFGYCEAEKDVYRYQGAEYSFIGFDESTHFSEFVPRYMLSRLRSTDPGLFLRLRLASNPGNIGHVWHRNLFQGPSCTHCGLSGESRIPGHLYFNAVWPSDGQSVNKSTCFIPGHIRDHSLLGGDYLRSLEGLPGSFRKALLEGCWSAFEGQFFDCWEAARMVVPAAQIPASAAWPHWVGADYGFNVSQAAAYLLTRSEPSPSWPRGRVYVLDEYTSKHELAADFARSLWQRWGGEDGSPGPAPGERRFRPDRNPFAASPPRRILAWYLSPDAWSERGDGFTLADQMRQASGIPFEPASHDRIGGAMLLYTLLHTGEMLIGSRCRQLIEALATRIHDPHRPDDILKVHGDPLDDVIDAIRYATYSFIGPAKPHPASELAHAMTSPDPTVAMIQRRLAEEKHKDKWTAGRGQWTGKNA